MIFSRIEVDTEKLAEASTAMQHASGSYADIAGQLVGVSARLAALAALDTSGAGAEALRTVGGTALTMGSQKALIDLRAQSLRMARDNYDAAENAAITVLNSVMGTSLTDENFGVNADTALGLTSEYISQNIGTFTFLAGKGTWDIAGQLSQSPHPKVRAAGYLAYPLAVSLFGVSAFLDAFLHGKAYAMRNLIDRLEIMGYTLEDVRVALYNIMKGSGIFAPLNHHKTSDFLDYSDAHLGDNVNDLGVLSRNMALVDAASENYENSQVSPHNLQRYSGIAVQIVTDESGQKTAILYIPGTDIEAIDSGDLLGFEGALEMTEPDQGTTYEESTAITQLIDKALEDAGVDASMPLMMVGHSQGSMASFNASTNPYIRGKYNLKQVVSFGGPVGMKEKAPGVKYTEIRDRDDHVVEWQGHSGEHTADHDDRIYYTDTNGDDLHLYTMGKNPLMEMFQGHLIKDYAASLNNPEQKVLSKNYNPDVGFTPSAPVNSEALLVAGSRLPAGQTEQSMRAQFWQKADDVVLHTGAEIAKKIPEKLEEWGKGTLNEYVADKTKAKPYAHVIDENTAAEASLEPDQDSRSQGSATGTASENSSGSDKDSGKNKKSKDAEKFWEDPTGVKEKFEVYADIATGESAALEGAAPETLKYLGPDSPTEVYEHHKDEARAAAENSVPQDRLSIDWAQEFNLRAPAHVSASAPYTPQEENWAYHFKLLQHTPQPVPAS